MEEPERTYTLKQAHQQLAISTNGEVWNLLSKSDRTPQDDERMLYAAFASCYHWLQVGTPVHHQRGEWLIAHVYTELGLAEAALLHARRCLDLTDKHEDLMEDFDKAYALMALARAQALAGNQEEARYYLNLTNTAAEMIAKQEDKDFFLADFTQSCWFGLK